MSATVEIQDIEELRQREGIDDEELREQIRRLRAGDLVRLTFLTGPRNCETLRVRITSVRGTAFRGKLVAGPVSVALSGLKAGSAVAFTQSHIHSVLDRRRVTG